MSADPTQLPVAAKQVSDWPAYIALNVPAMAAGTTFAIPVTSRPVTKLTSATFPAVNTSMGHGYSAGGLQIAGPFGASNDTYSPYLLDLNSGGGFLVDYNRTTQAETNNRSTPWSSDLRYSFTYNAATPHIAYYLTNAAKLVRYDTTAGVMAEASNATFPAGGKDFSGRIAGGAQQLSWMQTDVNDRWFVFMNTGGTVVYAWDSQTDTLLNVAVARVQAIRASLLIDEPHFDHDGRYVYVKLQTYVDIGGGDSRNTMVWDLVNDCLSDLAFGWSHPTPLRSIVTGINGGDGSQECYVPAPVIVEGAASTGTRTKFATDSQVGGSESHRAGQWIDQGSIADQSYVMLSQEAPQNDRTTPPLGLTWTVESGSIYKTTISYAFQQVALGGIQDMLELNSARTSVVARYTKMANLAAIVAPSQWAINGTTLYVWRSDGLAPNNTTRALCSQVVAIAHETLTFLRLDNGSTHILGHHYSWNPASGDYYSQPRTTISRDGLLVLTDSNMNDLAGRKDVFVYHTPTGAVTPAPAAVRAQYRFRRVA